MCGGNIDVLDGKNIGTCDSCGSTMTLPNVSDERIMNLFDRANDYRLQNEFDKALATYESILAEDNNNAEAHWGCVLSKFGIEYVEDNKSHKRIPTCHRVQNESILADLDYKKALEQAKDIQSQEIYKEQAEEIAKIQKGILTIANNEEPYDIFICYKETDNIGNRTIDSTIAQDIYYQLVNEGFKVFFSRITLEDKLGTEYEPYIFAALNSAKVMLVIGTNKEYFNAIWVKNEWARFLDMSKKDKSKLIIPCYRDMDAYDLPDELSLFQSQDMSKIGFIQDLIRGIKKIVKKDEEPPKVVINNATKDTNTLLKRAFLFLEEANWNKADELLEEVLNYDPENAEAYLGKLMIEIKVNKKESIENRAIDFSDSNNYQKAIRFSNEKLRIELKEYCEKAKNKYNKLKEEKEEKENLLSEELHKYQAPYSEIKQQSKKSKTNKLKISISSGAILSFVGYNIMFHNSADIGLLIFMLGGILGIVAPIIILSYSKYQASLDRQKAKMILIENDFEKIAISENVKTMLDDFANNESIKYKGNLNLYGAKKIFKNESQKNVGEFVAIINSYKPKEIKEDPELRKKRIKKTIKKYIIVLTIILVSFGVYHIVQDKIEEEQRQIKQREDAEAQVFVPNLIGKTVKEAKEILENLGVNYEFSTNNPGVGGKNYASTDSNAIVQYQTCNGDTMYFNDEKYNEYNKPYIDKRYDKIQLTAMTEDMINGTGEYSTKSNSYYNY